jgi:hypothetical protein
MKRSQQITKLISSFPSSFGGICSSSLKYFNFYLNFDILFYLEILRSAQTCFRILLRKFYFNEFFVVENTVFTAEIIFASVSREMLGEEIDSLPEH